MRRRDFFKMIAGSAAIWPLAARGQQPARRTYRVGIVWANTPAISAPRFAAVRRGLRDLGYVEGENIVFEQRGPDRTLQAQELTPLIAERSEERRVGKKCRSRWS